ncbi:MAG: 4-hydroxyphenylpyruvate dioxygenase [Planctomycetota bacterium]|nr:4-hydroxyphenylpyruvate dioxygenase [Planctomycetota bacterium]
MSSASAETSTSTTNPLGIRVIDHLKFYVDDVEKWADFHERQLGLFRRAVGNAETGLPGQKAIVCGQGRVNFVFVEADGDSETAREIRSFVDNHGCGVRDIAFRVDDVQQAVGTAVRSGARQDREVRTEGGFELGSIRAYGDTVHTFIRRNGRQFLPGFRNEAGGVESGEIHLMMIDHIVANVEDMDQWVDYYAKVFGFDETAHFDIKTGRSALMSKVVGDVEGYIRLPINEPSSDNSQIQEFLDEFRGAGVQHIALLTSNIIDTVLAMRKQGAEFLEVPDTYYEALPDRVGTIRENLKEVQRAAVLVDRDREDGYLLQLFTKPIFERPTLFYEIIQRHGNSVGFGEGNFQALFEAIEREQEKRGSL